MRLFLKVRPGAGKDYVEKIDDNHYVIWVKEPPQHGLANKGVVRVLAKHLNKPKELLTIKSGHISSNKVLEVL